MVVIFERFSSVFNIEEKKMIKIDEETKKPINKKKEKDRKHEKHEKYESHESM